MLRSIKKVIFIFCLLPPTIMLGQIKKNKIRETSFYFDMIQSYQFFSDKIRNNHCQMYPSCSKYSTQAFKKHSFFKGITLTTDRLTRCSHDYKNYTTKKAIPNNLCLDPLYIQLAESKLPPSFASNNHLKENDSFQQFIGYLMKSKFYKEALIELQKRKIYYPNYKTSWVLTHIIKCNNELGEETKSLELFNFEIPNSIKNKPEIQFETAVTYFRVKNYNKAIFLFEQLPNTTYYYEKKIIWQSLSLTHLHKYKKAEKLIDQYLKTNTSLILENNRHQIENLRNFKPKKKWIAATIGFIPGAAYWYAQHKTSAITAFTLNSLCLITTIECIKRENYAMASLIGLFSLSFYIGSYSGGIKSVERYNQQRKQRILNKFQITK
ncbi:MAG: membrane protein insertion efficiency factor YidD [Bacteroidales bacterium]